MKEKISIIAVAVNIVLTIGKIFAGVLSGSALILAEGLHSLSDVFASAVSYAGIKISQKPSDKKHPYGHYKYEVLSGLVITLVLFVAGIGAIYESCGSFLNPSELQFSSMAFGVMIASAIVNEIMAKVKTTYGKKENSLALISDGTHSRVDVYASLGVIAGLVLARYWSYGDALFSLIIGLYIIKESFSLGKEAVDSLLDVSAGEEIEEKIRTIAESEKIELSLIKTQLKGSVITANLEIKLPNNLSVEEATRVSEKLRERLISKIDNLQYVAIQITTHDIETDFYKPTFGRGFSWQRKGKHQADIGGASAAGPGGHCVCGKCGYKIAHERGVPCAELKCSKCGSQMIRETLNQ